MNRIIILLILCLTKVKSSFATNTQAPLRLCDKLFMPDQSSLSISENVFEKLTSLEQAQLHHYLIRKYDRIYPRTTDGLLSAFDNEEPSEMTIEIDGRRYSYVQVWGGDTEVGAFFVPGTLKMAGENSDGRFSLHEYKKFNGTLWEGPPVIGLPIRESDPKTLADRYKRAIESYLHNNEIISFGEDAVDYLQSIGAKISVIAVKLSSETNAPYYEYAYWKHKDNSVGILIKKNTSNLLGTVINNYIITLIEQRDLDEGEVHIVAENGREVLGKSQAKKSPEIQEKTGNRGLPGRGGQFLFSAYEKKDLGLLADASSTKVVRLKATSQSVEIDHLEIYPISSSDKNIWWPNLSESLKVRYTTPNPPLDAWMVNTHKETATIVEVRKTKFGPYKGTIVIRAVWDDHIMTITDRHNVENNQLPLLDARITYKGIEVDSYTSGTANEYGVFGGI